MCQDPVDAIQVLAILPSEGDRQLLRDIFVHSNWRLQFAGALNELQEGLKSRQLGVVITDSCLRDYGWKAVLETADRMEGQPSVIVSSRLADDRLWAEVLNLGGFDVLVMPFERAEVLRCVALAWHDWQDRSRLKRSGSRQRTLHASA
jgi:DNA-binding NtrC family response regulator